MKKTHSVLPLIAISLLASGLLAVADDQQAAGTAETSQTQNSASADQGTASAHPSAQGAAQIMSDQIDNQKIASHFENSYESFKGKDKSASAGEIRQAIDEIRPAMAKAKGDSQRILKASVDELTRLADGVEKGTIQSGKKLTSTFAKTEKDLAQFHQKIARDAWGKKEYKKAGIALKNAADGLEKTGEWADAKLDSSSQKAIRDARDVSGKLLEGAGFVPEQVGKVVENLGSAIYRMGQKTVASR